MTDVFVKDVMTVRVSTIEKSQTVVEASRIMERDRVNCLVVMSGRSAVGMITDSDITRYVVSRGMDPSKLTVEKVMSSPVVFCSPADKAEVAAKRLQEYGINRLVVIENGNLAGIVTEADLGKAGTNTTRNAAAHTDTYFFEGMTKKPDWDRGSGFCDSCGNHEDDLVNSGGEKLCRSCFDKKKQAGSNWVSRKSGGFSMTG